jgi:hypothetical protein
MRHSPEARTDAPPASAVEPLSGPKVRARLAASVGGDLRLDGVLRPTISLREGGFRGWALVYRLTMAADPRRRIDPNSLNSVDAERVDLAAVEAAFKALEPAPPGERPPILVLPVGWSSLRAERSRRKLLRKVAAGQLDRGMLALCEVTGLDAGAPPSQMREVAGVLQPIFRGVLARVPGPKPALIQHLAGCGFTGAAIEAAQLKAGEDEAMMLRRVLLLRTIGPGVLVHGVRSVGALAAARAAGASWASLDIVPGAKDAERLLDETKTAAQENPGLPPVVDNA